MTILLAARSRHAFAPRWGGGRMSPSVGTGGDANRARRIADDVVGDRAQERAFDAAAAARAHDDRARTDLVRECADRGPGVTDEHAGLDRTAAQLSCAVRHDLV